MNQIIQPLPELEITEFRERYPNMFSDQAVDEIYCDPGWREILIALCDTIQDHLRRHPEVPAVTIGQIKSKFGELHFFYDGGGMLTAGAQ
ncbi:hypothetical protein [Pseudomonas caspiana]|uniref:hypothetical protein n=1 Tax=Pseudomonas caspiana TaxID=1451454 RepID=UPI0032EE071A